MELPPDLPQPVGLFSIISTWYQSRRSRRTLNGRFPTPVSSGESSAVGVCCSRPDRCSKSRSNFRRSPTVLEQIQPSFSSLPQSSLPSSRKSSSVFVSGASDPEPASSSSKIWFSTVFSTRIDAPGAEIKSANLQQEKKMSKKNDLGRRKRQQEFDLQREKAEKEKKAKKLQAKKFKMKIDGNDKKKKKKGMRFSVGKKKLKTKMTALTKAKAAQAMELDS